MKFAEHPSGIPDDLRRKLGLRAGSWTVIGILPREIGADGRRVTGCALRCIVRCACGTESVLKWATLKTVRRSVALGRLPYNRQCRGCNRE
jgi:hypothetical protein